MAFMAHLKLISAGLCTERCGDAYKCAFLKHGKEPLDADSLSRACGACDEDWRLVPDEGVG
jgi:hypothetical protein